jgi:predicted HicB family RNase H-like nuclease
MQKTETLNLRVSMEFKRRLIEEAKKEKRSVTNYIEAALSSYWDLKSTGTRSKATKRPKE